MTKPCCCRCAADSSLVFCFVTRCRGAAHRLCLRRGSAGARRHVLLLKSQPAFYLFVTRHARASLIALAGAQTKAKATTPSRCARPPSSASASARPSRPLFCRAQIPRIPPPSHARGRHVCAGERSRRAIGQVLSPCRLFRNTCVTRALQRGRAGRVCDQTISLISRSCHNLRSYMLALGVDPTNTRVKLAIDQVTRRAASAAASV
jgi:hypothetical protein